MHATGLAMVRGGLTIDVEETRPRICECATENSTDGLKVCNFSVRARMPFRNGLQVQVRIIEILSDEARRRHPRPHGVALFRQTILVVHEADENDEDGVPGRRPNRMHRDQTAAVDHEADGGLSGRRLDPYAQPSPPTRGERRTLRTPRRASVSCTIASSEDPSVMMWGEQSRRLSGTRIDVTETAEKAVAHRDAFQRRKRQWFALFNARKQPTPPLTSG